MLGRAQARYDVAYGLGVVNVPSLPVTIVKADVTGC